MMPWVEDARAIHVGEEIDERQICMTSAIRTFLDENNYIHYVIAAPKGFGKTLLLKAKRKSYEKKDYHLIPQGIMVDIPPSNASGLSNEMAKIESEESEESEESAAISQKMAGKATTGDFWEVLWNLSISMSVIKALDLIGSVGDAGPMDEILRDDKIRTPYQYFSNLLTLTPTDYHLARELLNRKLFPIICGHDARRPVAIFIDNIDQYFDAHLEADAKNGTYDSYFGARNRVYWYKAQIGLVSAIYRFLALNPHLKIYAAIRGEAFNWMKAHMPDAANLRGLTTFIQYRKNDLVGMLQSNIQIESPSNLVSPRASDPITRFFGPENLRLRQVYTGVIEEIQDYMLRHTFYRPRDLMFLGRSIVENLSPQTRTQQNLRSTINEAAASLGGTYILEITPHTGWLNEKVIFSLIDRNVMDIACLTKLSEAYNRGVLGTLPEENSEEYIHAFSRLWNAGLLGCVIRQTHTGNDIQSFRNWSNHAERFFDSNIRVPNASHYLVHPVLSSIITSHPNRSTGYLNNIDTLNVICPESPWLIDDEMRFVAQGDIEGSTQYGPAFKKFFKVKVEEQCRFIQHWDVPKGDDLVLVDHNPYQVIRALANISRELKSSTFKARLRIGLDWGHVTVDAPDDGGIVSLEGGPVVDAARLEPHSRPGFALVSEAAKDALTTKLKDFEVTELTVEHKKEGWAVPRRGQKWNVKKKGSREKPRLCDHLYFIDLLDAFVELA